MVKGSIKSHFKRPSHLHQLMSTLNIDRSIFAQHT